MLKVGVARVETTPELGTHLSGSGMGDHRPAKKVLDPLFAKAIVFESGGRKLCILTLDVCIITEDFTAKVRAAAKVRCGTEPENVIVHSLQIHSAPSTGTCMLDPDFPFKTTPATEYLLGSEKAYVDFLEKQAIRAIEAANADLEPVQMGFGRGRRDDLAANRREEKTIDPEVGVCCFRTPAGKMKATLLHYSCHPVNVFLNGAIPVDREASYAVSADWPGVWSAAVREEFGGEPLVLNGCCGNINPGLYRKETVWDHEAQGKGLAATAGEIIRGMKYRDVKEIASASKTLMLDYREVPAERLAEVERVLGGSFEPRWKPDGNVENDWFLAASTKSIELIRKRKPKFPFELQVFRIGDLAIATMPGEPFSEGQLAVKAASPAGLTIVAHMTSQYVGYVPTGEAYAKYGHEANAECTYWAKMAPGALERIVEQVGAMIDCLWK